MSNKTDARLKNVSKTWRYLPFADMTFDLAPMVCRHCFVSVYCSFGSCDFGSARAVGTVPESKSESPTNFVRVAPACCYCCFAGDPFLQEVVKRMIGAFASLKGRCLCSICCAFCER